MRSRSRRSFAVEVKSGNRRNATIIPTRVASPASPSPRPMPLLSSEPVPAVEKRRILPNLIVPEPSQAEPEPAPVAEERPTQRRRGRPRKAPPMPVEPVAPEPIAPEPVAAAVQDVRPAPASAPHVRPDQPAPAKRAARPGAALAPGERWKRRLGRWSR